jgi:hypothetical protein
VSVAIMALCAVGAWGAVFVMLRKGNHDIEKMVADSQQGPRMPHEEGRIMFQVKNKDGNEIVKGDEIYNIGGWPWIFDHVEQGPEGGRSAKVSVIDPNVPKGTLMSQCTFNAEVFGLTVIEVGK